METKKIFRKLKEKEWPLTVLFMEKMINGNTIPNYVKTINYDNGDKYISDDFYKHISTYESGM